MAKTPEGKIKDLVRGVLRDAGECYWHAPVMRLVHMLVQFSLMTALLWFMYLNNFPVDGEI